MDAAQLSRELRDTLDYLMRRAVEVEALCGRIGDVRRAIERATAEIARLEEREDGATLEELEAIVERVAGAQRELDSFARRLGRIWAPGTTLH